tara:strand:+ start:2228 stop:2557 length:330 start_codon:yes stop_codon:yes gene_type:complete
MMRRKQQKLEFRARRAEQKHPFQYHRATLIKGYIAPHGGPPSKSARFRSRRFTFNMLLLLRKIGRGGRIRTADPLLPKQMRYQTALRPDRSFLRFFNIGVKAKVGTSGK